MSGEVYLKLREQLDQYSVGFPGTESGIELKILKKLFTEEEADLFLDLGLSLETAEDTAARTGRNPEVTAGLLSVMAEKGLIFWVEKGDLVRYAATPFIVGIYEFQLGRMDKEMAQFFEDYLHEKLYLSIADVTPLFRPIPVNRSLEVSFQVAPYDDAREILSNQKKIAVADCICQVQQELIDQGCEKPKEVCFVFGSTAQYFINKGMGREITAEEAFKILDMCHDAGLVTQPASPQNPGGMCNCCGDCCGVLRAIKKYPRPVDKVLTAYYAEIDQDLCDGCEICVDRCQMEAITVDGAAEVDTDRCIGCGLCVTTCPGEAIKMRRKPDEQIIVPPQNGFEMMLDIAKARGLA
jgi:electron transport complex protein RnfB